MTSISSVTSIDKDESLSELFRIRKNFYNLFSSEFIKSCIYDAVDDCPFIEFTSSRKRKALVVRPFKVTLKFQVSEFLALSDSAELAQAVDNYNNCNSTTKLDVQRIDLIGTYIAQQFTDNLSKGLNDPEVVKAMESIDLSKEKLKNVLTTISIISPMELRDINEKNEDFFFNYMLFM